MLVPGARQRVVEALQERRLGTASGRLVSLSRLHWSSRSYPQQTPHLAARVGCTSDVQSSRDARSAS
jgi:hypothetical protein